MPISGGSNSAIHKAAVHRSAGGWNDLGGRGGFHKGNEQLTVLFSSFTVHGRSTGLPGIIPVEQKSVHWLSMGAASRNDLQRSFCTAAL